jgi:hypothetical protein
MTWRSEPCCRHDRGLVGHVSRTWGTRTLCDSHSGLVVEPQNHHVIWMADFVEFELQNSTKAVPEGTDGSTCTTGIAFFAECLRHSAKAILHSAIFHRQRVLCRVLFSETRQRKTLGKLRIKKKQQNIFLILGTTLQPYLLPYPCPIIFHYYFESNLYVL